MTMDDRALPFLPGLRWAFGMRTGGTVSVLGPRVADRLATAASYDAGAAIHELCALSNAELQSRANLVWELCNPSDSTGH
jgi:hypothetical protein